MTRTTEAVGGSSAATSSEPEAHEFHIAGFGGVLRTYRAQFVRHAGLGVVRLDRACFNSMLDGPPDPDMDIALGRVIRHESGEDFLRSLEARQ